MDIQAIRKQLQAADLAPSKQRGQNFLLDEDVIRDMVQAAQLTATDLVIEVGPGLGVLTKVLAQQAKDVLAMELDHGLAAELRKTIVPQHQNLTLFEGDALSKDAYRAKREWLAQRNADQDAGYKVIANLPYQVTSKLLREFMESSPKPASITVMVQKEVAQRATAKPGDLSLLGLSIQAYSQAKIVRFVPASSFYPEPEVDSAVLFCDVTRPNAAYAALSDSQRTEFWRLARAGFASKRKQLKNNLTQALPQHSLEEILVLFQKFGLSSTCRAQELSIEQWCDIVKAVS